MARPFIRLGDSHTHGGSVTSASARMSIDGIPVAVIGDSCSCPIPNHDSPSIAEGDPNILFDGRPVALEGHSITCGAALIPSQHERCYQIPLG